MAGRGGCSTGVFRGGGTSPVRAFRYEVDDSAVCDRGLAVEEAVFWGRMRHRPLCATIDPVPSLLQVSNGRATRAYVRHRRRISV